MKKPNPAKSSSELKPEYDFSKGVRGKYAKAYAKGTNIIALDPDVAEVFTDSKAVNDVLRIIALVASKRRVAIGKSPASHSKKKAV